MTLPYATPLDSASLSSKKKTERLGGTASCQNLAKKTRAMT